MKKLNLRSLVLGSKVKLCVAIFWVAVLSANVSSQRWIERDGQTLILNLNFASSSAAQSVYPHQVIQIVGTNHADSQWQGELGFVRRGTKGKDAFIRAQTGIPYQGLPVSEFPVPILDVGFYDLVFVQNKKRSTIGTVAVPAFRCYFNRPGDARQASSLADILQPVSLSRTMAVHVDRAQSSVDIAMSDFDHPEYVAAIIRAHNRGVRVRFVTDERAKDEEPQARAQFTQAGVPWISNGRKLSDSTYMHHKFMIVDAKVVLIGHAKGTSSHEVVNQSFVSINGAPLAKIYTEEFNQLWGSLGPTSDPKKRKFNTEKDSKAHQFCQIDGLGGMVRVDVGFGPSKSPSHSPLTRPLNVILAHLLLRATSDVSFLASGFGDIDIGHVIHDLVTKKGVQFYGVQGEPDWSIDDNPLIKRFRGEGKDGWDSPADVVRSNELSADQDWMNVHNRALVMDVLGQDTLPVVCFSSGAWCMGVIKADDSMVCIHDRAVSEQFLQHVGGTRARALRPLPHRNVIPTLSLADGKLMLPARVLVPLMGGSVTRSLHDESVSLHLGSRALVYGKNTVDSLSISIARIVKPATQDLLVSVDDLALLGLYLRMTKDGALECVDSKEMAIPVECSDDVLAIAKARIPSTDTSAHGHGLTFQTAAPVVNVPQRPAALTDVGLVVVEDHLPYFRVDPTAKEPIYVVPELLVSLEQVMRNLRAENPGVAPLLIVDGTGRVGSRSRNQARTSWRPRRGAGLTIRMPISESASKGSTTVRLLLRSLLRQAFRRIDMDASLLGGADPLKFLQDGDPQSFSPHRRPGLFASADKRNVISISHTGSRQIELEQSLRDFRATLVEDLK